MASNRSVIDIIIRALWEGDEASKSAEQGLRRIFDAAKITGDQIKEIPGISSSATTALSELAEAAQRVISLKPGTTEYEAALLRFEDRANVARTSLENLLSSLGEEASPEGFRSVVEELDRVQETVNAIDGEVVDIPINLNTEELDEVPTKLEAIEGEVVDVKVKPTLLSDQEMVAEFEGILDDVEKRLAGGLDINTAEDIRHLEELRKSLLLLVGDLTTTRIEAKQLNEELAKEPPGSPRARVIEELKALQEQLDHASEAAAESGGGFSPSDEDMDRLTMLRMLLKEMESSEIDINTDSVNEAEEKVEQLTEDLEEPIQLRLQPPPPDALPAIVGDEPLDLAVRINRVDDERLENLEDEPLDLVARVQRVDDQKVEALEGEVLDLNAVIRPDRKRLDEIWEGEVVEVRAALDIDKTALQDIEEPPVVDVEIDTGDAVQQLDAVESAITDLENVARQASDSVESISDDDKIALLEQNLLKAAAATQQLGAQQRDLINERLELEAKGANLTQEEIARLEALKVQIAEVGRAYRDARSLQLRAEEALRAGGAEGEAQRTIEIQREKREELERLAQAAKEAQTAGQELNRTDFVDKHGVQLVRTTKDEVDALIEAMKRRRSLDQNQSPIVGDEELNSARVGVELVDQLTYSIMQYDEAKDRAAQGGISLAPVENDAKDLADLISRVNESVGTVGPNAEKSFGIVSRSVQGAGQSLVNFGKGISTNITRLSGVGNTLTSIGNSIKNFGSNLGKSEPQVAKLSGTTNKLTTALKDVHPEILKLNEQAFPNTFRELNEMISGTSRSTEEMTNKQVLATVQMAALERQSQLLASKMRTLASEVASGKKSAEEAAREYDKFQRELAEIAAAFPKVDSGVTNLNGKLNRIGKTVLDLNTKWISMASQLYFVERAIQTVVRTVRIFGDLLVEGANFDLLERRFERLANEVGEDGETMRLAIEDATGGMLSSMEAMQLATQLLGLDLAQTADQAIRMSRVVTQLDQDVNELQLAISNQTTRRFDQLNVSVLGFEERLESLRESMAGMSEETIFTEAFLQQAEAQIDKVGAVSGTTAGSVRELSASWKDLKTQLGESLAAYFGPFLADLTGQTGEFVTKTISGMTQAADSVDDLRYAHERLLEVREELIKKDPIAYALFSSDEVNAENARIASALASLVGSFEDFEDGATRIFGSTEKAWRVLLSSFEHSGDLGTLTRVGAATAEGFFELNKEVEAVGYSMDEFLKIVRDLDDDMDITREEALKLAAALKEAEGADQILKKYGDEARNAALQTGELVESFESLVSKIKESRLESRRDELAEMVADGIITIEQAEARYQRYKDALYEVNDATMTVAESQRLLNQLLQSDREFTFTTEENVERGKENAKAYSDILEKRADLFQEFQEDLIDIDDDAERRRNELEAEYDKERADIINEMGQDLIDEERDYQRDRIKTIEEYGRDLEKAERKYQDDLAANERKLQLDIQGVQRDSAKRRIKIEADYYEDIAKLEADHQIKRQRIIEDAQDRILDAYANLDAAALADAQRDRDKALRREEEDYQRKRSEIGDTLQDALDEEAAAEQERIEELRRRHQERQDEEKRDYDFRLKEMRIAHDNELEELRIKHDQRMEDIRQEAFDERIELANQHQLDVQQLNDQAEDKRKQRQAEYERERVKLDDQYDELLGISEVGQKAILDAEEEWWKQRLGLIPGVDTGPDPRTGGDHQRFDLPETREIELDTEDVTLQVEEPTIRWEDLPSIGAGIPASQLEDRGAPPTPPLQPQRPQSVSTTTTEVGGIVVNVNINDVGNPVDTAREVERQLQEFFEAFFPA